MAQTQEGALIIAAKKAGITVLDYQLRTSFGLKKCTKCKEWLPFENFNKDKSRFDGLKAKCNSCDYIRKRTTPNSEERTMHLLRGESFCCGCNNWLPKAEVMAGGRCKPCINEYNTNQYKTNQEVRAKRIASSHKRRGFGAISPEWQKELMDYFDGVCVYCRENKATTFDHIIPVSRGGRTVHGNIVPACLPCNASKGNRILFDWAHKKDFSISEEILFLLNDAPIDMVYESALPK